MPPLSCILPAWGGRRSLLLLISGLPHFPLCGLSALLKLLYLVLCTETHLLQYSKFFDWFLADERLSLTPPHHSFFHLHFAEESTSEEVSWL